MSDWSLLTDQAKTVNQRVECQDFPHLSVTYDHKQRLADAVGWTKVCFCLVVGGPPSAGARPLCVLGKHLLYVLCPSLLWFLSWGGPESVCFAGLSASLCRTAALLWLLSSGFLTKMRHGDRVSARRKEGSIFSHSACSRSGSKNSSHLWIRGCATAHVGHGKLNVNLDFPNSAGSPHDNKSFILSSVVLSGKRKNPNNSYYCHYCLMKITPGYVSKHTCWGLTRQTKLF